MEFTLGSWGSIGKDEAQGGEGLISNAGMGILEARGKLHEDVLNVFEVKIMAALTDKTEEEETSHALLELSSSGELLHHLGYDGHGGLATEGLRNALHGITSSVGGGVA